MEQTKIHKFFKKIGISIILIISILLINNISNAVTVETKVDVTKLFDKSAMMPQRNTSGGSGMLPQYYVNGAKRMVTLDDSRLLFNTNSWDATMDGKVVYCADYGKYVRYGKYDVENIHWLIPGSTVIQGANISVPGNGIETIINNVFEYWKEIMEKEANATEGFIKGSFNAEKSETIPGPSNAFGYLIGAESIGGVIPPEAFKAQAEIASMGIMNNFLNELGHEIWPGKYSTSVDADYTQSPITATEGPEVVVMEQGSGGKSGYTENGGTTYLNDKKAFIFSACEDAYGSKEYASEYSLNDIQGAYWKVLEEEGGKQPTTHLTQNAIALYERAKSYEQFGGNFKATIDDSKAQIIVDRDNEIYIAGPYWSYYPYFEDISYMKSICIDNNENLLYDESHDGIEIILEGGKGTGTLVPGSNGIQKEYPRPGQKFFVKFSAAKAGYPKKVQLNARFEYINSAKATVDSQLKADANIYKYYGYCQMDGKYAMKKGSANYKFSWSVKHEEKYTVTNPVTGEQEEKTHTWTETIVRNKANEIYMPYIMMGEDYRIGAPQELTVVGDAEREYKIVDVESTKDVPNKPDKPDKPGITIDLTMELGGYVWVDADGGKESMPNGLYNDEERVKGVTVTLYKEGGEQIATTKTNENGEYRFTDLNSMYQYYVKFTYNGQYYQPTTYASSSTWFDDNWKTNSNATDKVNERLNFNAKFASIGSSPENYVGSEGPNKSYTRDELFDAGVIDEFGNPTGNGDASMVQYAKDCLMDAYTGPGDGKYDLYPVPSVFVIDDTQYSPKLGTKVPRVDKLYPNAYYINLGLNPRRDSDLAIKKDVDHVDLEINGQTHRYTYDTLESKPDAEGAWDISVRLSDAYYNTNYSREIYKSDYIYKSSMYDDKDENNDGIGDVYGKDKEDELNVYITYKIMIRNQALSIQSKVDEIVDFYDQDLEYVDSRSYIRINRGDNAGTYSVKASATSRYSGNTRTSISGYDNLYITGLDDKYLTAGQTAYVYLTFKVKKDRIDGEDWVKLDEEIVTANAIGVGKENIVEINGYTTRYAPGTQVPNVGDVSLTPAGIVDRDSNPGNLNPSDVPKDGSSNYSNFEDDTDKAPNIRLILYRNDDTNRVISGNIWEDARTESIEVTTTGDGIRDEKETLINGVTVQLVELMENGTEYVWREFGAPATTLAEGIGGLNTIGKGTGSGTLASETPIINYKDIVENYNFAEKHDGTYAFKSFMPGKYVVRFIYGDTVRTVTPNSLNAGGLNEKSYNGNDYKSTTYQEGIAQNKTYTWREKSTWNMGQETLGQILTQVPTFKPDASNNETTKVKDQTGKLLSAEEHKGYLYDITESDKLNNVSDAKDIESRRNAVIDYSDNDITNYIAEVLASHKADYQTMNDRNQLLNDLMANTKMTAETGVMVIELEYNTTGTDGNYKGNQYKLQNVDLGLEERPKAQISIDKEVTNVKVTLANGSILFDAKNTASNVLWKDHKPYNVGYKGNFIDESKFGNIENIRNKNSSKFGLVQLTMDEELMHGATIEISYKVNVTNVGEVDYRDNKFYYTGNKSENAQVVTTRVDQVIDYVANNLQFNSENNKDWKVISRDEIKEQGLVHASLEPELEKYNTIIITESLNKDLVPTLYKEKQDKNAQNSTSIPLVLTQLITAENDSDDLTYRNIVELVKTSNTSGRRMEYSVVGNQNPTKLPQEIDSDASETVRILPPFGNSGIHIVIILVSLASIALVIIGAIFIKKKVLKK